MSNRGKKQNKARRATRSKDSETDRALIKAREAMEAVEVMRAEQGHLLPHGFVWGLYGDDDLAFLPIDSSRAVPPLYHEKLSEGFDLKTVSFNCVLAGFAERHMEKHGSLDDLARHVRHWGVIGADGRSTQFAAVL